MYYVYALVDPINNLPFYIGKGKNDRMNIHLKEKYNPKSKKSRRIKAIRDLGFEPLAHKIYTALNEDDAYKTEMLYIKYAKFKLGIDITNRVGVDLRPPSRKGIKWTPEQIKKRSKTVIKTGVQRNKIISL